MPSKDENELKIKAIDITTTHYFFNGQQYNSYKEAKIAAIDYYLPYHIVDMPNWLADPDNLQKLVDLG